MKLPRWLVIAMLTSSVLAVLAAAGWWWVTWPERTAREFIRLMAEDSAENANQMMVEGRVFPFRPEEFRQRYAEYPLVPQTRGFREFTKGNQKFRIKGSSPSGSLILLVSWGQVDFRYSPWDEANR